PALLVDHGLVGINLFGFEPWAGGGKSDQVAAGAVARADVDAAAMKNRRGNHDVAISWLFQILPQETPIRGRHPAHAFVRHLHILSTTAYLNHDRGRIRGLVGEFLASPQDLAGSFV